MSNKAREALSEILDLIDKWRNDGVMEHWQYSQLFDVADKALAEPLRNCEVGTAEEQGQRLSDYCAGGCKKCKFKNMSVDECVMCWAQMPYEKGDNDE